MNLYIIEEVELANAVKIRLLTSMRIHLVIKISQIVRYKELVETESRRSKTNKSRRIRDRKNIKQKKIQEAVKYLV